MFRDRKDGGEKLAKALEHYKNKDVLVLGIPRGGVETAYYVAKHLHAQLSFVVTRKLGYPFNPEAAFGALAEDGSLFIFEETRRVLSPSTIQGVVEREQKEITRRITRLRKGTALPPVKGRIVIIVDDGIATGATLFATIELCKNQQAAKIVVAAPVASEHIENMLLKKADEVVILQMPPFYYAVSQGYYTFSDLEDEQVLEIMERWEKENALNAPEK